MPQAWIPPLLRGIISYMTTEFSPLDTLQEQCWSFGIHRVITVAGRVGILRRLSHAPSTPEAVAAHLELDPLAAGKVIRALSALGIVQATGEGVYEIVPGLRPFLAAGDQDLTPFLEHSHHLYDSWGENLEPWLRGEPWTTVKRGKDGAREFGRAMQAMGSQQARRLAQVLDQEGARKLLDVGGGFGHYARALCSVNPELTAVVLDKPETAALARQNRSEGDDTGRIYFQAGDYLQGADYGRGYDLVLMANILHQEAQERAREMVAHAAAALAPGGRLVILDFSIDDAQETSVVGALFAINMRSFGDTYTEPTLGAWMEAAGLGQISRTDLGPQRWIIVGRK